MSELWLTERQVARLTRKKRPSAQAQVLREAGIPFVMIDGRPVVMESALSPSRPQGKLVLA